MPRGGPRPECTVEGCSKPNKAHGLCGAHYKAKRNAEQTEGAICSVEGCSGFVKAKGMCNTHYQRILRVGGTEIREDWKMRVNNPSYDSWKAMLSRCENPKNASYHNYGGRGIKVCERWHRYLNFIEDMGERPIKMTLERLDNEKGYEPSNCRWASKVEQARNTRRVKLTMEDARKIRRSKEDTKLTNVELAKVFGISTNQISRILRHEIWGECQVDHPSLVNEGVAQLPSSCDRPGCEGIEKYQGWCKYQCDKWYYPKGKPGESRKQP